MRGFLIKNGDLSFNASGYFDTVSSAEKIRRDVSKRLSTDKYWGNNGTTYYRYNPEYGTILNNTALYSNVPTKNLLDVINNAVGAALNDMINAQRADAQLPVDEVIDTFDYYSYFDPNIKNMIKCTITVKLLNGITLDLGTFSQSTVSTGTYSLPGVRFTPITEEN